ncbi:NAD-dependent malic enzyme [Francisellaceae bacterium]|nr:NAD-dependent malic enzyme [Francisellaceae bacterium]
MSRVVKADSNGNKYIETNKRAHSLLQDPLLNKGSSFSLEELDAFKLRGIVAPHQAELDDVVEKTYQVMNEKNTNLERHIYLRALQDRNETLFYALLVKYPVELMPLVYTPYVGEACEKFSEIYRRPRGFFVRYEDRNRLDEILDHHYFDDTKVICVTDGGRILGLGDQGAGGMGIPIGKLSLYTSCAGIAPERTLPILLDVGTNNEDLLNDPLYIGSRHKRISEEEYTQFVDTFITAIKKRFPGVLLQWEDFAQNHALKLLNKYKDEICSFNDDIQGTAAVVTGSLLSAIHSAEIPISQQKVIMVGAGSAGVGISNLLVKAMQREGLTKEQAFASIFLVDRFGLITDNIESLDFQQPFSRPSSEVAGWDIADKHNITLLEAVKHSKATMIVGVSAQGRIFTEEVIKQLAANCEHPIIFPISNPNKKSEADPADVHKWTNGKAVIGTGSPFPPVMVNGKQKRVDQVNNCYIFPGLGLGISAIRAKKVTDDMFLTAGTALAQLSPATNDKEANFLQPLTNIRAISRHVAIAVAKEAVHSGLTDNSELSDQEIEQIIDNEIWEPVYLPLKYTL